MIPIKKRAAIPRALLSETVTNALSEHRETVRIEGRVRSDLFHKSIWTNGAVRKYLWEDQHKKCCYCEKLLELKRESDVEHFRPKAKVTGIEEHPGYWWLAYSWKNLLYSCKHCNSDHKVNYFPISEERDRVFTENDNIDNENPLLINPTDDDPADYLIYYARSNRVWMRGVPINENREEINENKGENAIKYYGLNRPELLRRRFEKLETVRNIIKGLQAGIHFGNVIIINEYKREALRLIDPENSFAGLARYYFEQAGLNDHLNE